MRTVIAGSRSCNDIEILLKAIDNCPWTITSIVCGKAEGADSLGEAYGLLNFIPIHEFPADWNTLGRKAGPIRNEQMAKNADCVIVLWDGESSGAGHMIRMALKYELPLLVYEYKRNKIDCINCEIFGENYVPTSFSKV